MSPLNDVQLTPSPATMLLLPSAASPPLQPAMAAVTPSSLA
eukprot:CAMPEP_0115204826 /NCGR_PEP_ID=MMETSP0270-20121206/19367_1 /TAXON_ID=71861 /ORGANISM="Scrippsiella trochoidea, Strain CCMP3099" /LENGTH=40 /DNA_ID= /DNA_START= /DNA_END= /DNA_ORIENTATION=